MTKEELLQKAGGFMLGVCHPGDDPALAAGAHLKWMRTDIPYPFDETGRETDSLVEYRNRARRYAAAGIRSVVVTPYPHTYIRHGIDVTSEDGLKKVREITGRMAQAMGDTVGCWQATNEMFVPHFRAPLTSEQAVKFVASTILGLRDAGTGALVGQNNFGEGWSDYALEIERLCGGSDYAGVDNYSGTWAPGGPDSYIPILENIAKASGLPVILMEFGFSSKGKMTELIRNGQPYYDNSDVVSFLNENGFRDAQDMLTRQEDFVAEVLDRISPDLAESARTCAPVDRPMFLATSMIHLMKTWPCVGTMEHTEANQALFYERLIPQLIRHPDVCGAMIYDMKDSYTCFSCGKADCPCETGWGLTRLDGSHKPAYDTVSRIAEML